MNTASWLLRPRAAARNWSPLRYESAATSISWPFAARAQPRSDSTTVTGSLVTSSDSSIACAASRSTIVVRRASPCLSASASISAFMSFTSRAFDLSVCSSSSSSAASSFCSPRIFISSSFAK